MGGCQQCDQPFGEGRAEWHHKAAQGDHARKAYKGHDRGSPAQIVRDGPHTGAAWRALFKAFHACVALCPACHKTVWWRSS